MDEDFSAGHTCIHSAGSFDICMARKEETFGHSDIPPNSVPGDEQHFRPKSMDPKMWLVVES